MKFCWVTLQVDDLEQSLQFYRDLLGLALVSRFAGGPDVQIAMLGEQDKPKIELICDKAAKPAGRGAGISIGFEVGSLEEAAETAKSHGINIVKGPFSPNPHIRFFFVKDPNGFEIQLVENR